MTLFLVSTVGCKTTPETTPAPPVEALEPATGINIAIEEWEVKYDVANKVETDKMMCYKVLKIVALDKPKQNIWYKAGLWLGDYIVMIENRPGSMGAFSCSYLDSTIITWFPGKVRDNIYDEDGFWIERLRFDNDGGFSLKTLNVKYE